MYKDITIKISIVGHKAIGSGFICYITTIRR
jgi:hypothetical protein